jgi:tRNA nucleotidyltransferase (CCA-adding enzyme)
MTAGKGSLLQSLDPHLKGVLEQVCHRIAAAGGTAWLVGGSVRDCLLGLPTGDIDLEVFGLPAPALRSALEQDFELDLVGQSFGILKVRGWPIDVGLPRREAKIGLGHRGFEVHSDPDMPLSEAAARRDFTINAVYFDPLTGTLEDPFAGAADLERRVLRHTSPAFGEDPLRVLRGMQLAARFDLEAAPATVTLCRTIAPEGLARERLFGEWSKLVTLGEKPSRGLTFLKDTGWLDHYPELAALPGCPQDPRHHPEGDVWIHTLHCLDAFAAEKTGDYWEDLVVGLAVLCHDLGKPATTTHDGGTIRALGHEKKSVELAAVFLERLTSQAKLAAEVLPLVAEHMIPAQLHRAEASDAAVRRLAARVGRIDRLVRVARADNFGRPPLPNDTYPAGDWLLAKAGRLAVTRGGPEPLVQGRDLIGLGQKPGPGFGVILERVYEAQLNGEVTSRDQGMALARKLLQEAPDT